MWSTTTNVHLCAHEFAPAGRLIRNTTEIGHEKAQSVIDSITSSYAAEGQANPMLQPPGMSGGMGGGFGPPPPFGFPGELRNKLKMRFPLNNMLGRPGQMPPPFPMAGGMGARESQSLHKLSSKLTCP